MSDLEASGQNARTIGTRLLASEQLTEQIRPHNDHIARQNAHRSGGR